MIQAECSFPNIEQYTLEQLDQLIIEAQRILNARIEKTKNLCRWLLRPTSSQGLRKQKENPALCGVVY